MPLYRYRGGILHAIIPSVAATTPGSNPRESLVYGDYLPAAGTTAGLLNPTLLSDYNAASTQTLTLPDGVTIENKTIYGDLRLPTAHTADIVLRNCKLRGGPHVPTSNDAVVKADAARTGSGRLVIIDSEVSPQVPALNRDGIRGNRLQVERTWIHDTIDGFTAYATTAMNSGNAYSYLFGSIVENLRYGNPDYDNGVSGATEHIDGTHNDCVALPGGKQIGIKGNLLKGTSTNLAGAGTNPTHPQIQASGYSYGACILISSEVSNPPDATVVVEKNWMYGALSHLNIKANLTATVRNNRHYRAVFVDPDTSDGNSSSGYWIRYDQRAGNGVVIDSDVWVDGPYAGTVLVEPRDHGMAFNA